MTDRVMLLIDADNVSVDVIEQAVALLLEEHGALHVRRAYGTAESAVKCQAVFKRLSIRPMVNLSSGKNSTDIALAVDAIDLVLAERPDIVVIASSDSDFAPLVGRLREKGCRVLGIGQEGKTGDETRKVYDDFTVLAHRRSAAHDRNADDEAQPMARRTPARQRAPAARKAAVKAAAAPLVAPPVAPVAAAEPAPAPAPSPKTAARKRATRRKAPTPTPAPTSAPAPPTAGSAPDAQAEKLRQIFAELPELLRGDKVELRLAASRLRDAGLLSRNGTCTRLFGQFGDRFELTPARNPNHVRLRDAAEATAV